MIGAWVLMLSLLCDHFWTQVIKGNNLNEYIPIGNFLTAEFCVAACFVSMSAVVGKISFQQLFLMATIETFIFHFLDKIVLKGLEGFDPASSYPVFVFGAFYGLGNNYKTTKKKYDIKDVSYNSQLTSVLGTLFLFVYWPSMNSVLAVNEKFRQAAIVNTYLSMGASCLASVFMSRYHRNGRLNLYTILRATLAGGVAISASC